MDKKNSYAYIRLGLFLRMLNAAQPDSTKQWVLTNSEKVGKFLKELDFFVTGKAFESELFSQVIESVKKLEKDDTPIGAALAKRLKSEIYTLERVLYPESSIRLVYTFPQRRFNSEILLATPGKLFKDGTFLKFDEIARIDITSACRCLLFGEATASAFHILRATEAVLKSYYFHHRRQKRHPKPMWGNMIDQLKAKKSNKPPVHLLLALDNIRSAYRNPTQHPEAIYEIDAAQDLFGVCIDAMSKMGSELP